MYRSGAGPNDAPTDESAASAASSPGAITPPGASDPGSEGDAQAQASETSSIEGLVAGLREATTEAVGTFVDVVGRRLAGQPTDSSIPEIKLEVDQDARRLRQREARIVLDCGETDSIRHVGVIFVHGIGSQAQGATLREWGGSIIRVLSQFRIGEQAPADPVVTTQLDTTGDKALYIEVELPAIKDEGGNVISKAEHWVMTEAWWAQRVAPPPFGQMAQWLGPRGAVRRIITAMFAAQGSTDPRQRTSSQARLLARPLAGPNEVDLQSTIEADPQMSMLTTPVAIAPEPGSAAGAAAPAPFQTRSKAGVEVPAQPAPRAPEPGSAFRPGPLAALFERFGVGLFLQAVSALVLLLYGFLRSIEKLVPIGPLKDGALTRPIDTFLLDWFGDVHVLLGDPAQSASVRARLVDAIYDLEAIAAKPITIVAHSGGAIVTYLTLADPVTRDLRVDRVVTHGEAANLAWRLTNGGRIDVDLVDRNVAPTDVYGDLYRPITGRHNKVLWTDMWSSQDPAPVGLMNFPGIDMPMVESIGVWNRMSFREDHGTYWDNDEEFVIPLLRRLAAGGDNEGDEAARVAAETRFGSEDDHDKRSTKRRQRIAVLSFWTQFCRALPTLAIVHSFAGAAASASGGTVAAAAALAVSFWNMIPGHEIISKPVAELRTTYPNGLPSDTLGDTVAQTGVWVIAVVLAASAIFSLRAPPERSALFRAFPWNGYDIANAVALRAVALYLLVLATLEFVNASPAARPAAGILVAVVLGLALAEVLIARVLARPPGTFRRWLRRLGTRLRTRVGKIVADLFPKGAGFALPTTAVAIALAVSALVVVAPFVAMALFPKTADIVLGTIVIFVAFQLLLAVGKWRWTAWDARDRVEAQRRHYEPSSNAAVGLQMTIHIAAGLLLYFGIIRADYALFGVPLIVLSILTAGAAVLIGVGIDVTSAGRRRRESRAEPLAELIRQK